MNCSDLIFANKHLFKQFLKQQEYFNKLEQEDVNQVVNEVANQIDIKFYNENTFLFHYDREEYFDWYIILQGKASIYYPKSKNEIAQEINLFKQRSLINSEIDNVQRQFKSVEQNELLDKLQNKKLQVEHYIRQISSSKYDYIFQKYPSSYYKQHPQVLSFKLSGNAGKLKSKQSFQ